MKNIEQKYEIKAPASKVWQALVDPAVIEQWGGGPAKMKAKAGFEFSLWGGDIHGTNTNVTKDKLLQQDWFSGDWPEASKVSLKLKADGDKTILTLIHTNIPDSDSKDIDQGWKDYYLNPIKELLES